MKNYSLVILLWVASTTYALSHGIIDAKNPKTVAVLSVKKVQADQNIGFMFCKKAQEIFITNVSPIKEIRIYDEKGRLIHTDSHVDKYYSFDTSEMTEGKYAFSIQIGDHVATHIYEKE